MPCFRGTPSGCWLKHELADVFGIDEPLGAGNADAIYDRIDAQLRTDAFRPRALFERFHIEVLCTTDSATDSLTWHQQIRESGWPGVVRRRSGGSRLNFLHPDCPAEMERCLLTGHPRTTGPTSSARGGAALRGIGATPRSCGADAYTARLSDHDARRSSAAPPPARPRRPPRRLTGPADGDGADDARRAGDAAHPARWHHNAAIAARSARPRLRHPGRDEYTRTCSRCSPYGKTRASGCLSPSRGDLRR